MVFLFEEVFISRKFAAGDVQSLEDRMVAHLVTFHILRGRSMEVI